MTKARTNASASPAVGRNMVINGGMGVAQRAVSITGLGADGNTYNTVDRWQLVANATAGRFTMSQTADGPNGISANCLKLDCTTADTSIAAAELLRITQKFEGQNLQRIGKGVAGAKQITLSFYVKASAVFTFGVELFDNDNSRQITKLFDTTTDWVRHSFVIPADVDDGSSPFADDNALSLQLQFWLHAGATYTSGTLNTASWANYTQANRAAGIDSFFSNTANNFFLTGVQMEVGPVASEFEQEEITTTTTKCKRYYTKTVAGSVYGIFGGNGFCYTTDDAFIAMPLSPEMRAPPALDHGDLSKILVHRANGGGVAMATLTLPTNTLNTRVATVAANDVAGDVLVAGDSTNLLANNDATAYLAFSAEL